MFHPRVFRVVAGCIIAGSFETVSGHRRRSNSPRRSRAASEALAQMPAVTAMRAISTFVFYWR
jgi:hypothetical protein